MKRDRVFKSGLSKFCGRKSLKNLLSPLLNTLSQVNVSLFSNKTGQKFNFEKIICNLESDF